MLLRGIDHHCLKGSKVSLENWVVYWMLMRGLLRMRIGSNGIYREGHVLNNNGLPNLIEQSLDKLNDFLYLYIVV